jgi:hypothetical protein
MQNKKNKDELKSLKKKSLMKKNYHKRKKTRSHSTLFDDRANFD